MQDIQFDDIATLQSKVSDEFGDFGESIEVSQEMINQFAELTGDHQWIHVDVERAKKESPFGQTIAHGFLTLSLLPRLRTSSDYRVVGYGNATNYGADKLRFISPVPAGAKVHARSRVVGEQIADALLTGKDVPVNGLQLVGHGIHPRCVQCEQRIEFER